MTIPHASDYRVPDLRFVSVDALVPHEQFDEQRMMPLARRMREQAVLKNPPVVSPLASDPNGPQRYVVLDGANRTTAARHAGFPHMLVQVVPYTEPHVLLSTWAHALGEYSREDFEQALSKVPGLEFRGTSLLAGRALLARREAIACVAFDDGSADTLHGGSDLHARSALLNALVDSYHQRKRFVRVTTETMEDTRDRHPEITSLVVFPHFEPAEVIELATSGARLPAGVTRHLIRWRALRLNIPIDRLADSEHGEEDKNRWLADWLRERLTTRQVRWYEEPTVLFDE